MSTLPPLTVPNTIDDVRKAVQLLISQEQAALKRIEETDKRNRAAIEGAGLEYKANMSIFLRQSHSRIGAYEKVLARLDGQYTALEHACHPTQKDWERLFKDLEDHTSGGDHE